MADVFLADRIGRLNGIRRNVTIVLKAVVYDVFGAVVTGSFVITVLAKVMVEADAVGQTMLVYEIDKLIHGLCPNNFYISADR